MITGFTISNIEGKISSVDALGKQRFPKLNINIEGVTSEAAKLKIKYTFVADYFDGDSKESKTVGQIKLGGEVEITESKDAVQEAVKRWGEKHILPVAVAEEVINGLNFRCSATGTLVSYALGLIPPLVISTTKIQETKS
jgi:hypothetical protein